MTNTPASAAEEFLARFVAANEADDTQLLGDCFADSFLAGDRHGARPIPRAAFLAALPRRRQMFADAGVGPSTLTAHTVTELDEHYLLVRTEWAAPRLDGSDPVQLTSSFLLYRDGGTTIAVAYLNHQGLEAAQ